MGMLVRLALCAILAAALLLGGWFVRHELIIWWTAFWVLFIKFLGIILWAIFFLGKMIVALIGKALGVATFGEILTLLSSRFLRSVPGKILWAVIALLVPMRLRAYYRKMQIFGRELWARIVGLIKTCRSYWPSGTVGIMLSLATTLVFFLVAVCVCDGYAL